MFKRQTTGSVVCASCGSLVGVNDETCYNCGRRNPGLWGFAPALRRLGQDFGFVPLVTYACGTLYVVMLVLTLLRGGDIMAVRGLFGILSPGIEESVAFGAAGAVPVFGLGMWWTVLSAGWLHGSILHILFNMLWVRQLAPATAEMYGPGRMVIIYTASSVAGFTLSSLAGLFLGGLPAILRGAPFTLGASAAIFGLLGALVYYGRRAGSSFVGAQALQYAFILGLFGFIMPGIDNYAHGGGFLGGYLTGRLLDPLQPERINHMVLALGCLLLSALAVLASLVVFLPQLLS